MKKLPFIFSSNFIYRKTILSFQTLFEWNFLINIFRKNVNSFLFASAPHLLALWSDWPFKFASPVISIGFYENCWVNVSLSLVLLLCSSDRKEKKNASCERKALYIFVK